MLETIVITRTLNLGIINALLKGTNNQLKANCESQRIFLAGKKEIPFLCNQMTIFSWLRTLFTKIIRNAMVRWALVSPRSSVMVLLCRVKLTVWDAFVKLGSIGLTDSQNNKGQAVHLAAEARCEQWSFWVIRLQCQPWGPDPQIAMEMLNRTKET